MEERKPDRPRVEPGRPDDSCAAHCDPHTVVPRAACTRTNLPQEIHSASTAVAESDPLFIEWVVSRVERLRAYNQVRAANQPDQPCGAATEANWATDEYAVAVMAGVSTHAP